ncbi:hypothetical protein FRC17_001455 [Serendipita sp. 399]|nr:hypothetical protein FRC17_001455 [Serendipita sp. 399]
MKPTFISILSCLFILTLLSSVQASPLPSGNDKSVAKSQKLPPIQGDTGGGATSNKKQRKARQAAAAAAAADTPPTDQAASSGGKGKGKKVVTDTGSNSEGETALPAGKSSSPLLGLGELPLEKAVPSSFKGELAATHDVLKAVALQCKNKVVEKFAEWKEALQLFPELAPPVEVGLTQEVSTIIILKRGGFMGPFGPELKTGLDGLYAFEVALEGLKIYALLQMKVEKFELKKEGAPNFEEPTVDWTYESGSAKNLQMDLVQKTVLNKDVHVLGGYIIFSVTGITFIPIEDVIEEYKKHKADLNTNKEEGKRKMTKVLMGKHRKESDFIDAMIEHADPTFHARKAFATTKI